MRFTTALLITALYSITSDFASCRAIDHSLGNALEAREQNLYLREALPIPDASSQGKSPPTPVPKLPSDEYGNAQSISKGAYDHNMNVPATPGIKKGGSSGNPASNPVNAPILYHDNGKKIKNPGPKPKKWGGNRIKVDGKLVKNKIGRPGWDKPDGAAAEPPSNKKPGKPKQPKTEVKNGAKTLKDGRKVMAEAMKAKGQDGQSIAAGFDTPANMRAGPHAGGSHKYNVVTATIPDDPKNADAGTRAHHLGVKYDKNRVASWDGTDSVQPAIGEAPNPNKKKTKAYDPEGTPLRRRGLGMDHIWKNERRDYRDCITYL